MAAADVLAHVDAGTGALARGDGSRARVCFLHAARELLLLAREGRIDLRAPRCEQARRLLATAHRLGDGQWPPASQANEEAAPRPAAPKENPRPPTPNATNSSEASAKFKTANVPDVCLDDVAGADDVKRTFKAKFLFPLREPRRAATYRQQGKGGVLLYGPPGTGKTFLARALAGELGAPVFSIKPSDIMSKWVGEAEQRIAELFREARKAPVALIFVDEIDALAPARGRDETGVTGRVLAQLLAELDGFERHDNKLLFVGATNAPWAMDAALLRPGRFDALCFVDLPDRQARRRILADYISGVPLAAGLELDELAELTEGHSGAEVFAVASQAAQAAYFDVIENGIERPVGREDFERALASVHRAATPELMRRYEEFAGRQA